MKYILIGFIYDLLSIVALMIFTPLSFLNKKTNNYRKERTSIFTIIRELKKNKKRNIVFYCSSVGEFEQAIPLIRRFDKNKNIIIFFHSSNGYEYCKNLISINIYLTPFDLFFNWLIVLNNINPEIIIINKNEFWPGFMLSSSYLSHLFIINYTSKEKTSLYEKSILSLCTAVFSINQADRVKFINTGDTRHDRLTERYDSNLENIRVLNQKIKESIPESASLIVIGNGYQEDYKLAEQFAFTSNKFKFLLVPSRYGIDPVKSIRIDSVDKIDFQVHNLIIFDSVGMLFELYGCADMAWVGGGFSNGIHNVLEPAFYGIPVISGPELYNQQDALELKNNNKLFIFKNADELNRVLNQLENKNFKKEINKIPVSPTEIIYKYLHENNYTG